MKTPPTPAWIAAPGAATLPRRLACPYCNGHLHQTQSRLIDSLTALFLPGRHARYCCRSLGCGWEGNLRVRKIDGKRSPAYDERRLVLAPSMLGSSSVSARASR